jgi:hypothetical protein
MEEHNQSEPEDVEELVSLHRVSEEKGEASPFMVKLQVEGQELNMELDTGSGRSIVGRHILEELYKQLPLYKSKQSDLPDIHEGEVTAFGIPESECEAQWPK